MWQLVLSPDFKSACRDAERSEVCSIRTHPRQFLQGGEKVNVFDLVVLVLIGVGGITGFQKGLITGIARLAAKIAAIAAALLFHRQFLDTVEPVFNVRDIIEPRIEGFLINIAETKAVSGPLGEAGVLIQPVLAEATSVVTDYTLKICSILVLFLLVSLALNIIISLVITPLAKSLGLLNRGGGLFFGALSTYVVLCLIIGLVSPFLASSGSGVLNSSLVYPWLIGGYEVFLSILALFAHDILTSPLESFPLIDGI